MKELDGSIFLISNYGFSKGLSETAWVNDELS